MKVTIDEIITGVLKYANVELYDKMNEWQEVVARLAVGRVIDGIDHAKQAILDNGFIRTFQIFDDEGKTDLDRLTADLSEILTEKQGISFKVPMYGTLSFTADDVSKMKSYIMGGVVNE